MHKCNCNIVAQKRITEKQKKKEKLNKKSILQLQTGNLDLADNEKKIVQ